MTSDLDLLRQFARENSQDAFAEIVRRHLNLVYSAALRQVRLPQLAEEVAQFVFADLARNAGKLKSETILTAWLYSVTRRTAIDVIRKESRRQLREQVAVEMQTMNATANDWTQIAPLLDDAMTALDETDRTAILLRYFENKNLREVGEQLNISDDAAQKRVSRAVERLREFFLNQKITIGASGLVVLISANAVQPAPVGLSAVIVTATSGITATLGMTMIHKILAAGFAAAAIGSGIYSIHLQKQIGALQQQQASLNQQLAQLSQERDDAKNQLVALQQENEQLNANKNELLKLRGEVSRSRNQQSISTPMQEGTNKVNPHVIQVLTKARLVSIPAEDLQSLGVNWISESQENKTGLLSEQQMKVIDEALQQATDVKSISAPRAVTINGEKVQISVTRAYSLSSVNGMTETNVGVTLEVKPYFSTNSSAFDLSFNANVTQAIGDAENPSVQTIQFTNDVTVATGQTLIMATEIPNGSWLLASTNAPDLENIPPGPRSFLMFLTPQVVKDSDFPKSR